MGQATRGGVMLKRLLQAVCASIITTGLVAPAQASEISGVHEVVFGVTDIDEAVEYWERFGYRVIEEGKLSKKEAMALHNVPSSVKSARLKHLDSDHNMVRIWEWKEETGPGAGTVPLLTPGARWASSYLKNQIELYYQAVAYKAAGNDILLVSPQVHANGPQHEKLHMGDFSGFAEVVAITPDYRRVFAQRWGEERPNFGSTENYDSHFQATQMTHVGFTIEADDPSILDFYPNVLGIKPRNPENFYMYEDISESSRNIYGVPEGTNYGSTNYGNPTDTATEVINRKSGSLLIRRVVPGTSYSPIEARPGAHGLTLFTYAVKDVEAYHAKVSASDATKVTKVLKNEFGEKSFSFIAPDGMDWTLVEWKQ